MSSENALEELIQTTQTEIQRTEFLSDFFYLDSFGKTV